MNLLKKKQQFLSSYKIRQVQNIVSLFHSDTKYFQIILHNFEKKSIMRTLQNLEFIVSIRLNENRTHHSTMHKGGRIDPFPFVQIFFHRHPEGKTVFPASEQSRLVWKRMVEKGKYSPVTILTAGYLFVYRVGLTLRIDTVCCLIPRSGWLHLDTVPW